MKLKKTFRASMNVVWSDEALDVVSSLRAQIAKDSPKAAQKMALAIIAAVKSLQSDDAELDCLGRVLGTREQVIPCATYFVPDRASAVSVRISRQHHGAKCWPDRF